VLIIGDYTTKVGDPSGRSATRPMLTDNEIEANAKTYQAQAGKILDLEKTEIRRNSEWFGKMSFADIIGLASQFTVARMIEREDFAARLKARTEIHMHELLYPMMQAYDSVIVEADVEIGATDQTFNILAGRDLQRKMGKPEQAAMFLGPILVGTDGTRKMSKSYGNYVGLADTPADMYGKVMSIPDSALWDWFALCTYISQDEGDAMRDACKKGTMNPRDAKMRLAREIVTLYHSAEDATVAEAAFVKQFQKKELPNDIAEHVTEGGDRSLVDLLVETGLAESKSDAKRTIEQGGVKVKGEVVTDVATTVAVSAQPALIQKGKRGFVYVVSR